jgi:hypothetical protein
VVDAKVVVNAASEYQVRVPVAQVADSTELSPAQMVAGAAAMADGAAGIGVTVTVTFADGLTQVPFTQAA